MNREDEKHLREVLTMLQRSIGELKASEHAMKNIFLELARVAPKETAEIFAKYPRYYAMAWEKLMLMLETEHPDFAAELDKKRPLISPPDEGET